MLVLPSIVMWLSSYITTRFPSWRCPANDGATRGTADRAPLPDGFPEPLPERPGGGLAAGRQAVLRVPWRAAPELAEALQLLHRQVVARNMQQGVEQDRAGPDRKHDAG